MRETPPKKVMRKHNKYMGYLDVVCASRTHFLLRYRGTLIETHRNEAIR